MLFHLFQLIVTKFLSHEGEFNINIWESPLQLQDSIRAVLSNDFNLVATNL